MSECCTRPLTVLSVLNVLSCLVCLFRCVVCTGGGVKTCRHDDATILRS